MKDAFQEWDLVTEMKMMSAIFTAMDVFLGGVGIVTLGLGAVGIINIMLVSVSERTAEIGLRKALGATERSILAQFFWEGAAADRGKRRVRHSGFRRTDGPVANCPDRQDAGMGSSAPGALVGRAGAGLAGALRGGCGTLSCQQSRDARPGGGAAKGVMQSQGSGIRDQGSGDQCSA